MKMKQLLAPSSPAVSPRQNDQRNEMDLYATVPSKRTDLKIQKEQFNLNINTRQIDRNIQQQQLTPRGIED